jgi:dTDP-glucose 4,6-dehydratase
LKKILVTGACGFIGSSVVRKYIKDKNNLVVCLDALKYSGCIEHLEELKNEKNIRVETIDLVRFNDLKICFEKYSGFDLVIHLAAESSVDKSIKGFTDFVNSNVLGTCNLLHLCKEYDVKLVIQFITDEVYGHLHEEDDPFTESTPIEPRNIYSASKASQFHFGMAWFHTFDLPIINLMPANNYGPRQLPEKLLPRMIYLISKDEELPIYGNGLNIRTWLYVDDTAEAVSVVEQHGIVGQQYNIGSGIEMNNLQIIECLGKILNKKPKIKFIEDRKGHDFRYSICDSKLKSLGFQNKISFEDGLKITTEWYLKNFNWLEEKTKELWSKK